MNSLWQRIVAHDQAHGLKSSSGALGLLEWTNVTSQVASWSVNGRTGKRIRNRTPYSHQDPIALQHTLADELRSAGESNQWPPLLNVDEMLDLLNQPPPVRFEGTDLVHIAAVARELDHLREYFLSSRLACPTWGEAAVQMGVFSGIIGAIDRALDLDGRIVDSASSLLARLRRSLQGREQAVRSEMNQALSRAKQSGWTTGSEVTMRGDRFCLPMRSGDSRRVDGIVHDRSATGATLYVEPAQVVHLANDLAQTRLEIAAEEARIIFELNRAVEMASDSLLDAAQVMLLLDEVRSGLLWSRQVRGHRPLIAPHEKISIHGGRHPLLMAALGEGDLQAGYDQVVPLHLEVPDHARALVISGPNAGGKSVALKSVGIFCLLAQCGWDIPAREDTRLPLISRLLVDVGDDQSIAEALSSFSAHLAHLSRFMKEADAGTLVLCDEIGSGTDPQEGTALAFAVLENLTDSGAQILASTHFGLLKAAVHDHPHMVNAAMDYDEDDLRALFTFRVGDPGTSHAFDIAARMGFDAELLDRAREMAGIERVQIEKLLADLDKRARDLTRAEVELHLQTAQQIVRSDELALRLKGLKKEKKEVLAASRNKADCLLDEGRQAIEKAVRQIKSSGADKAVVKSARSELSNLGQRFKASGLNAQEELPVTVTAEVGLRVRIPHLGLTGVIEEVRGSKVVANAGGMRLTLGVDSIAPLDSGQQDTLGRVVHSSADKDPEGREDTTNDSGSWSFAGANDQVPHELDLRGMTGQEGWEHLDKLIDRAIPTGLSTLNVIHGFGTGRLRDYLYDQLKRDSRVAGFREASPGQGGGGATLVTLTG